MIGSYTDRLLHCQGFSLPRSYSYVSETSRTKNANQQKGSGTEGPIKSKPTLPYNAQHVLAPSSSNRSSHTPDQRPRPRMDYGRTYSEREQDLRAQDIAKKVKSINTRSALQPVKNEQANQISLRETESRDPVHISGLRDRSRSRSRSRERISSSRLRNMSTKAWEFRERHEEDQTSNSWARRIPNGEHQNRNREEYNDTRYLYQGMYEERPKLLQEIDERLRRLERLRDMERDRDLAEAMERRRKRFKQVNIHHIDEDRLQETIRASIRKEMRAQDPGTIQHIGHSIKKIVVSSETSSLPSISSEGSKEEHPGVARGHTYLPNSLVSRHALIDLGYPFELQVRPHQADTGAA